MGRAREGTDKHGHVGVRERKKEINVETANVCVRAPQQPGSPSAIRVVLQEQGIRLEERCSERARIVHRAIDEGRTALHGLHVAATVATSLEEAFSDLWDEVTPDAGIQLRMFVQGTPRALQPAI